MTDSITPFRLDISQADLDDLDRRLARTRWPDATTDGDWDWGVPVGYLRELVEHWRTAYDWRAQEAELNELPQFTTTLDGHDVHYFHIRSPEPTRPRSCCCTAGPGRRWSSSTSSAR